MRRFLTQVVSRIALVGAAPLALLACKAPSKGDVPALSKATPVKVAPAFESAASPGAVPCGDTTCPVTKAGRKVCCNTPGQAPSCKSAERCGQGSQFTYAGMLSCNETADCKSLEPGRDVVCCLTDDGSRSEGVEGPFNRAGCVPRAACKGSDVLACVSDADCKGGTRCRRIEMGVGVLVGGCLP